MNSYTFKPITIPFLLATLLAFVGVSTPNVAQADIWSDVARQAEITRATSVELSDGLAQFQRSRSYRSMLVANAMIQRQALRIGTQALQHSRTCDWRSEIATMEDSMFELEALIRSARIRSARGIEPRTFGCTLYLDDLMDEMMGEARSLRRLARTLDESRRQANVYEIRQYRPRSCPLDGLSAAEVARRNPGLGIYGGFYDRDRLPETRYRERGFSTTQRVPGAFVPDSTIPEIAPGYQAVPQPPVEAPAPDFESYPGPIPAGTVLPEGTIINGPYLEGPAIDSLNIPQNNDPNPILKEPSTDAPLILEGPSIIEGPPSDPFLENPLPGSSTRIDLRSAKPDLQIQAAENSILDLPVGRMPPLVGSR